MDLYRAVGSKGNIIIHLNKTINHKAPKRFFKKALRFFHTSRPGVITDNKNIAYLITIEKLEKEKRSH